MFTCPANHSSETREFCSVCGLEIPDAAPTGSPPAARSTGDSRSDASSAGILSSNHPGEKCPDCDAPRESPQHVFCEVCGYNFATRASGSGPPKPFMPGSAASAPAAELANARAAAPANSAPSATGRTPNDSEADRRGAPAPTVDLPPPPAAGRWELTVNVDANLYVAPNPDAPTGQPPSKFRLFDRETMIGRAGTEVRVQVPVHGDEGVSRRHLLLIANPDGALLLRDLNSSNGTQVNGVDVLPGVDTPLGDGAAIAIGAWTRITIRAVDAP